MNGDEAMYQHELVQQQLKGLATDIIELSKAITSLLNIIEKQQQQINELHDVISC